MKVVRENINEKFTEKSDPVDDMGIGYLADLQKRFANRYDGIPFSKMTPNQLLIVGVNHYSNNIGVTIELIEYALKNGANQLWCNDEGTIREIVKIVKAGNGGWRDDNPKITFKRVWTQMNGKIDGSPKTSTQFSGKYRAITKGTLEELEQKIKQISNVKEVIKSFNTKLDDRPY